MNLGRLPEKVATAAIEYLYGPDGGQPASAPAPRLKLGLEGLHSARRGDRRIIYEIDEDRGPFWWSRSADTAPTSTGAEADRTR